MNIMEPSRVEKRRYVSSLEKNSEIQIQIGFTSLVENTSQEKVKRTIVETSAKDD